MAITQTLGQKQFAEIPLSGSRVWDVQAFEVGDSLFVVYDEIGTEGNKVKAAAWVTPAGQIGKLRFDELQNVTLMDVVRKNDLIYYYILSEKKKSIALEAIEENRTLRKRQKLSESITLPGEFLASFVRQSLMNVVCFDREKSKILVTVLDGRNILGQHEVLSIDRKFLTREGMEFFDKNGYTNASRGNLGIKMVVNNDLMSISVDHLAKNQTKIFKVSLPDFKVDSTAVNYQPADNSSSMIYNEHLYRLSGNGDQMFLEVFRLSDGKRITLHPLPLSGLPENVSYSREGDKSEISKERTFKLTGTARVVDFSIVVAGDDQYTYLRLGSHMGEKPPFIPVGQYAFQMYVANSMSNAVRNNDNTPGINRYFYLRESKDHTSYQIITNPNDYPGVQRADEHEIVLEKGYKVTYKAYERSADATLTGIYCYKKKLVFVRY